MVYGSPTSSHKVKFWQELTKIGNSFSAPWLCLDDFNCIMSQKEKSGGRAYGSILDSGLYKLISNFALIDMGFQGNKCTWTKKREKAHNTRERLDGGICIIKRRDVFMKASITHLPVVSSNHAPLLMDTNGMGAKAKKRCSDLKKCEKGIQQAMQQLKKLGTMNVQARQCFG